MSRLSVAAVPRWDAAAYLRLVHRAEELGLDTFWVTDQTFYHDPFALLGALATSVRRIGLGVGVTNPYSRHPVQLARSAATLAQLAGPGRVRLGIGAGNRTELLARLGMEQTGAAERCRAAVGVIRALLAGETVSREGAPWILREVRLQSPVSEAVPLYLAARAPGTLRTAGEVADGAIVECLLSPDGVAYARSFLGPRPLPYIAWGVCHLAAGRADVPASVLAFVGHLIASMPAAVQSGLGLDPERMAAMKAAYVADGPPGAARFVGADELTRVSFVGAPDEVAARLRALATRGVDEMVCLLHSPSLEENLETLDHLATQVLPLVR